MRIAIAFIVVASAGISTTAQSSWLAQSVSHAQSRPRAKADTDVGKFFAVSPGPTAAGVVTKSSVLCGMRLLPADPKTDPSIRHATPDGTRFAMRAVHPAICGDDSAR